jgi:hypothetical protein
MLRDSTGSATAVSFSITGTVESHNRSGGLFGDYLVFNSGFSTVGSQFDWRISGLVPGASHQIVLYGANTNANRTFNMLVDTDGDGDLADEAAVPVPTLNSANPAPAYFSAITASASGEIVGRAVGVGSPGGSNEGEWAGFQLTDAEPFDTLTLTAAKDSFLRRGNPDRNEGANPELRLQASGDNRVVVAFDPAAIADFGSLTTATLVLTIAEIANNWGLSNDRTVDAHPLTVDFAEGNGQNAGVPAAQSTRGSGPGVTWNCAEDTEIANQQTNCDPRWNGGTFGGANPPGVVHVNGLAGEVSWDVTQDVEAGVTAWLVKKTDEGQPGRVSYHSKDGAAAAGDPDLAPRLILEK